MFCLAAVLLVASSHAADVGLVVTVGQPGYYGRLEIGSFPQPQLIYAQPVVIRPETSAGYQPLYLRVPPGHAKNWREHCRKYDACGRPVYFVQDRWYNEVYVPGYRDKHHERGERAGEHGNGHDKGLGKGHAQGRGKGHDKGHNKD